MPFVKQDLSSLAQLGLHLRQACAPGMDGATRPHAVRLVAQDTGRADFSRVGSALALDHLVDGGAQSGRPVGVEQPQPPSAGVRFTEQSLRQRRR